MVIGVAWLLIGISEEREALGFSGVVVDGVGLGSDRSDKAPQKPSHHQSFLHFLFGKNFERATRIDDQRGVKRISGEPSERSIFQVNSFQSRRKEYFCFAEHYCACYSFFYDIVNKGEQLCCKHQLAARLAVALGACIEVKVSDEQLAQLLVKL
ncbi:hypothetical protein EZV62_014723 [Acer yangbiense]|uniref:SWIM-type domain-containing protein n=1 Tax=Acer yangbiense TaxID=1000413 RepID=A0A5C7HT09_9ROSI|nr:hypothetical protein EZV62_014723 [Acer yangbiense]